MLDAEPPPSPFPSSLIADLAQEAVEKVGWDFLKALGGVLSDKGVVSKKKATLPNILSKVNLYVAYTDQDAPWPCQDGPASSGYNASAEVVLRRGWLMRQYSVPAGVVLRRQEFIIVVVVGIVADLSQRTLRVAVACRVHLIVATIEKAVLGIASAVEVVVGR
jgi:hypothetical protein